MQLPKDRVLHPMVARLVVALAHVYDHFRAEHCEERFSLDRFSGGRINQGTRRRLAANDRLGGLRVWRDCSSATHAHHHRQKRS
jgi:hypothetical protein